MGAKEMASLKWVAVALLATVCGAIEDNMDDTIMLKQCVDSHRAMRSVCNIYGESSKACVDTKRQHESAGCLGESGTASGIGCKHNNFDKQTKVVCQAAQVICNVPGKDYCETSLLVDCMKSIGQMCGGGSIGSKADKKAKISTQGDKTFNQIKQTALKKAETATKKVLKVAAKIDKAAPPPKVAPLPKAEDPATAAAKAPAAKDTPKAAAPAPKTEPKPKKTDKAKKEASKKVSSNSTAPAASAAAL